MNHNIEASMEIKDFNTFKFLRAFYNIPSKIPLQWCIIKEWTPKEGTSLRLGISIGDGQTFVDIARRRFFSCINLPACQRSFHPAQRISSKDNYIYQADDLLQIILPKSYIKDIYETSWYTKEILHKTLL